MFQGCVVWRSRLPIRVPLVVGHALMCRSQWQGTVVFGVLLPLELRNDKLPPLRLQAFPGQEFEGGLACSSAAFVATMIMVEHDQIQGLLGELSFAAVEIRANQGVHHLDQRGGPHDGFELLENQRFERLEIITKETFGERQPLIPFRLMVTFLLGSGLMEEMVMMPGQNEKTQDIARNHFTELRINRLRLCKRPITNERVTRSN